MAKWTAFPYDDADYSLDAAALKKQWTRLHLGDAEPLPKDDKVLAAWALFHAEVIDKVGKLLGKTQGADTATGLKMYQQALKLNPGSAIAMVEYANGLVMLEGDKRMKEAEKLYADAAACVPMDAMERLDVEMAKAELED